MNFWNTRQAARILGITPVRLAKAVWDGRVPAPEKSPSGNFLWAVDDVERASWALLRRSSGLVEKTEAQPLGEILPELMDDIAQRIGRTVAGREAG